MAEINNTNKLMKQNDIIDQVTVSALLDGRYFFIPSYQRGYRWTKQQIYDLCNDLLEYVLKTNKGDKTFYSLQPLIVRKSQFDIDGCTREAYEVIDGQQRLTSIFILYRFLAKALKYNDIDDVEKDYSRRLYHIFYETRPDDYCALEKSGFEPLTNLDVKDIDIAHVSNAYYYLDQWLNGSKDDDQSCAEATFSLFSSDDYAKRIVVEKLFKLLNAVDTNGSVLFIWYEIDKNKDAIKEFLTENKGKIRLTDTEKIKALFMQRSNFENDIKNLKQLSIAKDWELVENTLHRNDFWAFISNDTKLEDGRINIIFQYIYENDLSSSKPNQRNDYLFRYFSQRIAKKKRSASDSVIANEVDMLWSQVMDCYRMFMNWYYNPKVYNLVGLLVKHGCSINDIAKIYNRNSVVTNDDFVHELNMKICREIINKIPIKHGNEELDIPEGEEYIHLFFNNSKDKAMMHDLLRFVNVCETNNTIDKALNDIDKEEDEKKRSDLMRSARDVMSHIYRFPFEALDVYGWDIEHVDSATTNSLTDPKEQEDWLKGAEEALDEKLSKDESYLRLKDYNHDDPNSKKTHLKAMVDHVHKIVGEDESDVRKNWIGNLTLLDAGTNRSYKNKIFAWKRSILLKRIRSGVFVPICTQNIFNKNISNCSDATWRWSHEDKKAYHSYLLKVVKEFKQKFTDNKEITN